MNKSIILEKTASLIDYKLQKEALSPIKAVASLGSKAVTKAKPVVRRAGKVVSDAVAKLTGAPATMSDDAVKYITGLNDEIGSLTAANKKLSGDALKNSAKALSERANTGKVARKAFGDKLKAGMERNALQDTLNATEGELKKSQTVGKQLKTRLKNTNNKVKTLTGENASLTNDINTKNAQLAETGKQLDASNKKVTKVIGDAQKGAGKKKAQIKGLEDRNNALVNQGKQDAKVISDLNANYTEAQKKIAQLLERQNLDAATIEKLVNQGKIDANTIAELGKQFNASQEQIAQLLKQQGVSDATIKKLTTQGKRFSTRVKNLNTKVNTLQGELSASQTAKAETEKLLAEAVEQGKVSAAEAARYKAMVENGLFNEKQLADALEASQIKNRNYAYNLNQANKKLDGATKANAEKAKVIDQQSAQIKDQLRRIRNLKWGIAGTGTAGAGLGLGGYMYANNENERRYNNVKQAR